MRGCRGREAVDDDTLTFSSPGQHYGLSCRLATRAHGTVPPPPNHHSPPPPNTHSHHRHHHHTHAHIIISTKKSLRSTPHRHRKLLEKLQRVQLVGLGGGEGRGGTYRMRVGWSRASAGPAVALGCADRRATREHARGMEQGIRRACSGAGLCRQAGNQGACARRLRPPPPPPPSPATLCHPDLVIEARGHRGGVEDQHVDAKGPHLQRGRGRMEAGSLAGACWSGWQPWRSAGRGRGAARRGCQLGGQTSAAKLAPKEERKDLVEA